MALNYANNQSLSAITALPASISGGALTLLQTQTASGSSSISFTSNIDSTYDKYIFKFYDIHDDGGNTFLVFGSTDGGSSYGVSKTTTYFTAVHTEDDVTASLAYNTSADLANSTAGHNIYRGQGANDDDCVAGTYELYAPSSTTFVKHFMSRMSETSAYANDIFTAGYFNTTSAINAIKFEPSSGVFDGTIKMYGVS